jgi:DNA-binding phage protein
MKDVKVATSRSYREHLIASLQDSLEAAAYIQTFVKLDEEGYDPKILRSTLAEVVEARKHLGDFSDVGQQHFEKLDKMLGETGGEEILALIEFLDALGYRIGIVGKE